MKELLSHFAGDRPVPAAPAIGNTPQCRLLGSSPSSAQLAGGVPMSLSSRSGFGMVVVGAVAEHGVEHVAA
ncbi:hypothetical protein ACWEOE_37550, partial [Amycolatopsis sp. NPDC004368]